MEASLVLFSRQTEHWTTGVYHTSVSRQSGSRVRPQNTVSIHPPLKKNPSKSEVCVSVWIYFEHFSIGCMCRLL